MRIQFPILFAAIVHIALFTSVEATCVDDDSDSDDAPICYLIPERLYNGAQRSMTISIDQRAEPEGGDVSLTLTLLEDKGNTLLEGYRVQAGQQVDLASQMPVILRIRRACYLQLMRDGQPLGSALVLQPMLSRLPIWTQREFRPDGSTAYTHIVGWGTEPPQGWREPEMRKIDTDGDGELDTFVPIDELEDPSPELEPVVFSGLRIYPERDVMLHTTLGDIRVAFTPEEAPNTAWNFLTLAESGFYDGIIFHRIVPLDQHGFPFVIQGGDPTSTGSGGPGYWLPLEPSQLPHDFGVISMARADDPDSAGSQFFFCLSRDGTARLNGQYCAFGFAVEGGMTIKAIASTELADVAAGKPKDPPTITRANLVPAPPRKPGTWRWLDRVSETSGEENQEDKKPERVPR